MTTTEIPKVSCFINNKRHPFSSTYDVISPVDRTTVLHKVEAFEVDKIEELMDSSQQGFQSWKDTSITDRRKVFLKALQLLQERLPQLIEDEVNETTVGTGFASFEVGVGTVTSIEETAAALSTALRGELAPNEANGKRQCIIREPLGGVLSIVPWNAPSVLCTRAIVNPIAAGNAVILKTSEFSPKTQTNIAQLFYDAGLPTGVLNTIHVSPKDAPTVVKALIEHPFIRKVNFTGSTQVGRIIASLCASVLKPAVLELGGKAPVVVTDDADIELAANNIIFGGLMNQGQICMATANLIVHKNVAEQLKTSLGKIMEQNASILRADPNPNGPPAPDTKDHRLRALFTVPASERVKGLYEDAIASGAKIFAGKPGFDTKLGLVQPVFLQATEKARLFSEEAFAPIIGLYTYEDDQEAVRMANAPGAGLSASVFSKNETRAWKIARNIESGAVHINGITVHDDQNVPHGGCKISGYGRFNGVEGIREFMYQKTVTITPGIHYPYFAL